MMVTISLAFPEELLRDIDRVDADRAAFLERATRQYLARPTAAGAAERDARDKSIYELHADELNAEATDVLGYGSGHATCPNVLGRVRSEI